MNIASLNDFYWAVRAGFHLLANCASESGKTDSFLPPDLAMRWSKQTEEVQAVVAEETRRLCFLYVVQSVTFYEDYIGSIVHAHVVSQPLPDKKPRLQVDLSRASVELDSEAYMKRIYAAHVRDGVLRENYGTRPGKVHKVLGIDPEATEPSLPLDLGLVAVAGEVRNTIVHCNGVADERAMKHLSGTFSELSLGSILPLDEPFALRLGNALREHVEAIDLLHRITAMI